MEERRFGLTARERESRHIETIERLANEKDSLRQALTDAQGACQRLRVALQRYGHHESGPDGCRYEGPGFGGPPCTCGLDEALK